MTDAAHPPLDLPPGRRVELPGRGTTFVRDVAGPPGAPTLVLLHGLTATADLNWFACYERLGREFNVVALDQRGHGRGIRTRAFRLEDCADDVTALADVLGLGRIIPVGYSMGGPVAQLVWRRHPDRVQGLVLCATSRNFLGDPRMRAMLPALAGVSAVARVTPAAVRRGVLKRFLPVDRDDHPVRQWAMSELRRNDPASVLAAAGALGRFSSRDWIGGVDVPTAVVVTDSDELVPTSRQYKLAAAIPGATVHVCHGGHDAAANRHDCFVPVLLEACRSVARRAPRTLVG